MIEGNLTPTDRELSQDKGEMLRIGHTQAIVPVDSKLCQKSREIFQ